MHVLFVHKNFPAQFGHIAAALIKKHGYKCSFVSETDPGRVEGIYKIQYAPVGGATSQTHVYARSFENAIGHASGIYETLKGHRAHLHPDLIVGHSGFGSTLFLSELFPGVPIINLFEYFYQPHGGDLGFRPEFPVTEVERLRAQARNAMLLLDLENCTAGYAPMSFQHGRLPSSYQSKVRILHDGVPTDFWQPRPRQAMKIGDVTLPPETPIVTYVSRGFESMRGFDIFMQAAKRICAARPDVHVIAVGTDRVCYGPDLSHIDAPSFREHVLHQDTYDLERIHFVGRIPPQVLSPLLSRSDVHLYLTVPFVLSWSCLNAMACGCTVVASDTAPVREVIRHRENGILCDFFDVDGFAQAALEVLADPEAYREHLGIAARRTIEEHYSMDVIMPQMVQFYEDVVRGA